MKLIKLIASAALIATMSAPGAAVAHTVIGGWAVPEGDAARVANYCRRLGTQRNESLASTGADDHQPQPSGLNEALVEDVDLDTLTVEQCEDAGLIPRGRPIVPEPG